MAIDGYGNVRYTNPKKRSKSADHATILYMQTDPRKLASGMIRC